MKRRGFLKMIAALVVVPKALPAAPEATPPAPSVEHESLYTWRDYGASYTVTHDSAYAAAVSASLLAAQADMLSNILRPSTFLSDMRNPAYGIHHHNKRTRKMFRKRYVKRMAK